MSVYARQVATAKRLIKKYGEVTSVTVKGMPTENPDFPGQQMPGADTQHKPSIAFFPLSSLEIGAAVPIHASLAYTSMGDLPGDTTIGYMAAEAFEPNLTTVFKRKSGAILKPIAIMKLDPNGETILYMLVFK